METKCHHCGSVEGGFRSFRNNRTNCLNYYWVCVCGCNYGHAETEDGAFAKWWQHCEEAEKLLTTAQV